MNINEFQADEIVLAGARLTLTREDALRLIQRLASHGNRDTWITFRVLKQADELVGEVSVGGGLGDMFPVEDAAVRVREAVTA